MERLVKIGRGAVSTVGSAALVLVAGSGLTIPTRALAVAQSQLSLTCQFDNGPRAGQIQSFADMPDVQPMPLGIACTDGEGSTGIAIPDSPGRPLPPVQPGGNSSPTGMTFTCQFNSGPRAGQNQSYAGVTGIQAMPVGSECTDGQGNTGFAIVPVPVQQPGPAAPPPVQPARQLSFTCQFNSGPRAGQIQSYAGVTGMQPMELGSACTDGQGNIGIAIPDRGPMQPAPAQQFPNPAIMDTAVPCGDNYAQRNGQTERDADQSGTPQPIGAPCNDTQGSNGSVARGPISPARGITSAAVGAGVGGLRGAVWADPDNSGFVTGYTYNGHYHPGTPPGYDPAERAVVAGGSSHSGEASPVPPETHIPAGVVVGAPVDGLQGALWTDLHNDGVVDGYIYNGQYYPGVPPGFAGGSVPAPAAPAFARSGERG